VLLFASFTAGAQPFSMEWHSFDGGGGTSTGGVYSASGTIGQSDATATPMTGGNYSLAGGFWTVAAIQTPGAPRLTIFATTTNTLVVSWPSLSPDFSLQQDTEVDTPGWVAPAEPVTDNGRNKFIIINPPAGNRFYRLFKP
jgi:hypothetical protein